jgi:hypothetical protein
VDDATDTGPEVGEPQNIEPNLGNDDDEDKSFFDKGHGTYSAVERLLISLLRIL